MSERNGITVKDLTDALEAMEGRLKEHVTEQCFNVETKLLTEFHKWGRRQIFARGKP